MSETTVETGIPVLFDSLPILVEDFDFPTYLGDPAPEPSLTSSLVRELLQTAPRKVRENCARLNPDYKAKQEGYLRPRKRGPCGVHRRRRRDRRGGRGRIGAPSLLKEKRAAAYAAGMTPIKIADMHRVKDMEEAAKEAIPPASGSSRDSNRASRGYVSRGFDLLARGWRNVPLPSRISISTWRFAHHHPLQNHRNEPSTHTRYQNTRRALGGS